MSGNPDVQRLEAITWTPNQYGVSVLICRDCLTPLLDDEEQQIPVGGPFTEVLRAGLTHVNLFHHD